MEAGPRGRAKCKNESVSAMLEKWQRIRLQEMRWLILGESVEAVPLTRFSLTLLWGEIYFVLCAN